MNDTPLKLGERGRNSEGNPRILDARLWIQLLVFSDCLDATPVKKALAAATNEHGFEAVLYGDANDPRGIGVLVAHESPDFFATTLRAVMTAAPFASLTPLPAFTMLGRTYSIGYEMNLEDILLHRPRRRMCHPDYTWAVWYPLRRAGSFERLEKDEQNEILMEHARLGISFSQAGYGQDIRLACHGVDRSDNDFVIGLLGSELYPLSAMVQSMRKTKQTSLHLESLGPFFVGRTIWQSPVPAASTEIPETSHA